MTGLIQTCLSHLCQKRIVRNARLPSFRSFIRSRISFPSPFGMPRSSPMPHSPSVDNPVRVIVIEDNADDCELLLHQLKKGGMDGHVKFIADGQEALDFLTGSRAPALANELIAAFIDLKLPSLGGLELLRRLRASDKLRNLPIIIMTSSNNPKDIDECRRLNVVGYVSKPVSFTTFSKAVADVFHLPHLGDNPAPQEQF